ncbi:hypothetical protein GCM10027406_36170 [Leifsonia lichenia]
MPDYVSNHADLAYRNLAELIEGVGKGFEDATDDAMSYIDAFVHEAAVQLLNAMLPPIVHGNNAVTRSTRWVATEATTVELALNLGGATVSNTTLAGLVAEQVERGITRITSDLDYTHGVNSIT